MKKTRELRNVLILRRKTTRSTPVDVVKRLIQYQKQSQNVVTEGDEFWAVIDHDRHDLQAALKHAEKSRFPVRFVDSNPCFEIWLLLHHDSLQAHKGLAGCAEAGCESVIDFLERRFEPQYNKAKYDAAKYIDLVAFAIANAKFADFNPETRWLNQVGSRVYRLVQSIIDSSPNNPRN